MKKKYEKPEIEILEFMVDEKFATSDDPLSAIPGVGEDGAEDGWT